MQQVSVIVMIMITLEPRVPAAGAAGGWLNLSEIILFCLEVVGTLLAQHLVVSSCRALLMMIWLLRLMLPNLLGSWTTGLPTTRRVISPSSVAIMLLNPSLPCPPMRGSHSLRDMMRARIWARQTFRGQVLLGLARELGLHWNPCAPRVWSRT